MRTFENHGSGSTFHFRGTLTERNVKSYVRHTLELPGGQAWLSVRLEFAPAVVAGQKNMLTLTIFDPEGFRGAGHRHGNRHEVTIGPDEATPGYLPGRLPPGPWTIEIDTHMVMPGEACSYSLEVATAPADHAPAAEEERAGWGAQSTGKERAPALELLEAGSVAKPEKGWFRGDLHSHTLHSDASWSAEELVACARSLGLDFLALTDHNTTSGLREAHAAAGALLLIDGMELTTYWGHALCLGSDQWVDWRTGKGALDMASIARERIAKEETFVIAHPASVGDPYCTGCRWVYEEMRPGPARLFEVWNGPWDGDSNNEEAVALWYDWLTRGVRIFATGGSDTHKAAGYARNVGFNVVRAEACDQASILKAVRSGSLFITRGPGLYLEGITGGGARVAAAGELDGEGGSIEVRWTKAEKRSLLRIVADGRVAHEAAVEPDGVYAFRPDNLGARWYVAELRDPHGEMGAITNPIFTRSAPV